MERLEHMRCVACRGDEHALTDDQIAQLMPQVPDWSVVERDDVPRLERRFETGDFVGALSLTSSIGRLAEAQDHHPVLQTEWGAVTATWWTHKIDGLHRNDFIMAAKSDAAYERLTASSNPGILAVHGMYYTPEAEAARAFLKDKVGLPARDVGDGWLIFDVPTAEIGCHPEDETPRHTCSLVCRDIDRAVQVLRDRGVAITGGIEDAGWGRWATFDIPGGLSVEIYEPAY